MRWLFFPSSGFESTNSIQFDGVDERIERTDSNNDDFNPGTNWGISFWVKFNSVSGNSYMVTTGANNSQTLSTIRVLDGRIDIFNGRSDGGGVTQYSCSDSVTTNTWYHIVVSGNGVNWFAWINNTSQNLTRTGGDDFYLGEFWRGNNIALGYLPDFGGYIDAFMDEVMIFSKTLDSTDVNSLYNGGTPANPVALRPNLSSHWRMGEQGDSVTTTNGIINRGSKTLDLNAVNMESGDITTDVP